MTKVRITSHQAALKVKPADKTCRHPVEQGLYLEVTPKGGKYWRWKYRFAGKEKRLAIGVFPEVGLAAAREARDEARKQLKEGTDPLEHRKAEKRRQRLQSGSTFEAVAGEWLEKMEHELAPITYQRAERLLQTFAFPFIGSRPVNQIEADEVLEVLRRVENKGHLETCQRLKQRCSQVFRYAIATGRAKRDPAADLRGALKTPKTRHHAAVTKPDEVGALLRAIDGYSGHHVTHCALRLLPHVFVRPGELRFAEWNEFDLEKKEWRIPARRMKMDSPHLVPLSDQAVAILEELHQLTGKGKFVFPSIRTGSRPMSENTINAALRRLGYAHDEMTGHGFRSVASTLLRELGWPGHIVEIQLAHAERNKVTAAYNYAEHIPERKKMMAAWSDYLNTLKSGDDAKVVALKSA